MKECKACNGEGSFYITDCCGAEPRGNGDSDSSDIGMCPECGDHCEYGVDCEDCNGTGIELEYDKE